MISNIENAMIIIGLMIMLAACSQNCYGNEVGVQIEENNGKIEVIVYNLTEKEINVENLEYGESEFPPSSISIRIRDENGKIYSHQSTDPGGWWSPSYIQSTFKIGNSRYTLIKHGEKFVISVNPSSLIWGARFMRALEAECEFQIRFLTKYYYEVKTGKVQKKEIEKISRWLKANCIKIFEEQ